jgi:hypothetical protein
VPKVKSGRISYEIPDDYSGMTKSGMGMFYEILDITSFRVRQVNWTRLRQGFGEARRK